MIDVCFCDSFSGLLKMSTKSDGVFHLFKGLNFGNLDCDDLIVQEAKRESDFLRYFYRDITEKEIEKEYKNLIKQKREYYKIFDSFLAEGHEIRLWISNCARDRCGLFWLCKYLENYSNKLFVVTCPGFEYKPEKDRLIENRSWSAFSNPYFVDECSESASLVYEDECCLYSELWDKLVAENAPLRILVNDVLVGVNEDFFDDIIMGFVDDKPKNQRTVMENMLGEWRGLDISFVSERIEHLISKNKIKVCNDIIDDYGCYWVREISRV